MDLVCKDRQLNISPAYLKPGFAFGGSCLPKDLRATMHLAKMRDVELPMHAAILPSNRGHIERAIEKVMATGKRRIGMVGLSFKTGTDDLRESPLVLLAEHFIGKGLSLLVYDPEVHLSNLLGANRRFIEKHMPHLGIADPARSRRRDRRVRSAGGRAERREDDRRAAPPRTRRPGGHRPRGDLRRRDRPPGRYEGLSW